MTGFRVVSFVGLSLLLSGCFPLSVYYREGAEVSRIDSDLAGCHVSALKQVPVRNQTRYVPPVYGYRTVCNAAGACHRVSYLVTPGRWETYDANEGLRAEVAKQCMLSNGYQKVRLRACPPSVIEDTTITATRVQPPLTGASCAIRIKGDRYQIVTP